MQRDNNQLEGSLPEQLGNVVSSPEVSTGGNSFSGPIPSTFGTQIVYLENSNFSQNLLSGSIPPSIFSLKMLQILDLHGNSLNQSIPWNRTQLTALQIPSLSSNQFSRFHPHRHRRYGQFDVCLLGQKPVVGISSCGVRTTFQIECFVRGSE